METTPAYAECHRPALVIRHKHCVHCAAQVVQGSSVQEAVEWAQQAGSVAGEVQAAIAAAVELKGSGARGVRGRRAGACLG